MDQDNHSGRFGVQKYLMRRFDHILFLKVLDDLDQLFFKFEIPFLDCNKVVQIACNLSDAVPLLFKGNNQAFLVPFEFFIG